MKNKTKAYTIGVICVIVLALLLSSSFLVNFRLDQLWFKSVGYDSVFWQTLLWKGLVGLGIFGIAFLLSFANLRGAFARCGQKRGSLKALATAAVFGLIVWGQAGNVWFMVLQTMNAVPFGVTDPQLGWDISRFVYWLPFLQLLYRSLMSLLALNLAAAVMIYLFSGPNALGAFSGLGGDQKGEPEVEVGDSSGGFFKIHSSRGRAKGLKDSAARAWQSWKGWPHCGALLGLIICLQALTHLMNIMTMMYDQSGISAGAGATQIKILLPGYLILAGLSVLFGLVIAVSGRRGIRRGAWALGIYLVVSFLVLGILPGAYQQFIVDPNEISREQPYISRSIDYTKLAYSLDEVETVEYPVGQLSIEELKANQDIIDNIRILDQNATHTTYSQQQELRRYYEFADVDVDRYVVDGKYTQVMVAAREMNPAEIPEQSKNFNNLMFQYTHGFGVAMSPANKVTSTGLPDYLVKDIPPVSKGITITQPRIYYGELTYDPVIVKTELAELDYTDGDNNKDYFYEEESGIPMKGLNRLLLAFRDMEYRYLFSGNINGDSLYLETRNVMDRAARIAPFLSYDNDPYLVITDEGRLVYMLDAYTHTNRYPYSQAYNDSGLNYLRNSVKVTVDAYNGEVNFYIFDEKDPIAATYAGIYPSLFKSREEMPGDLRRHVRYPEAMFEIQSLMLQDYHMSNPVVFYNREDRWSFADQIIGAERAAQEPYYTISRLPGETEEEFVMLRNFTPYGRDNMVAWLAGRSDGDNYGKLLLYTFSKGSQIPGPMQVESQIDQDAEISSQLSLWGQSGSDLIRGNMLVYPVDDSLLYVEPLYLSSDKNKYPQLLRIFVYYGDKIVMAESLSEALEELFPGYLAAIGAAAPEEGESGEKGGVPDENPGEQTAPGGSEGQPGGPGSGGEAGPPGGSGTSGIPEGGLSGPSIDENGRLTQEAQERLETLWQAGKDALSRLDWETYGAVQQEMDQIFEGMNSSGAN